jgi:hypothetical protein
MVCTARRQSDAACAAGAALLAVSSVLAQGAPRSQDLHRTLPVIMMEHATPPFFKGPSMIFRAACFAAVLVSSLSAIRARDVFVNNIAGDDRLDGLLEIATNNVDGPVRSINRALQIALPGDRIFITPTGQPYRESIALSGEHHSGGFSRPFTLEGNGAVLDGSTPIPDDAWEIVSGQTFRHRPQWMAFQQLFHQGKPLVRNRTAPRGVVPTLAPLEWCLVDGWIYFRGEPGHIPQQYQLSCAGLRTGITIYKAHDVLIRGLIVQGFQIDGIQAADGVRNGRLVNVTARGNGRAGVCVAGGSRLEVRGCSLGDNGEAQLLLDHYSLTRVNSTLLIGNTAPALKRSPDSQLWLDGKPVN